MKNLFLTLAVLCLILAGCQTETESKFSYKQSMISSGSNYPDFNFAAEKLDKFLVYLHQGKTPKEISRILGWDEEKMNHSIAFLQEKGFLKKEGDRYLAICMIISKKNGEDLRSFAEPVSAQIADSIINRMPSLKSDYEKMKLAASFPFDSVSFLLLSDVLLDNWQINAIENEYLHTGRTLHHGKQYYYSFLENDSSGSDPFGIYGNMVFTGFSVYGKNQSKVNQGPVMARLQSFPLIDSTDNARLDLIAAKFKPALLSILNSQQDYIQKIYKDSGYAAEVSFAEFFIWWYHFIYTRTTDILAERGYLSIPADGNYFYRNY